MKPEFCEKTIKILVFKVKKEPQRFAALFYGGQIKAL
jgi:hypothetical protein